MKNLVCQVFFPKSKMTGTFPDHNKAHCDRGSEIMAASIANGNNLASEIYKYSEITARRYAEKCGADYILFDEPFINFFNPTMERLRLILEDRWADEYDNVLYFDSDVLIHENCENLFEKYPQELLRVCKAHFAPVAKLHREPLLIDKFGSKFVEENYFNSGVLLFHKTTLRNMKPLIKDYKELFFEVPMADQSILNYCVLTNNLDRVYMDRAYNANRLGGDVKIAHVAGQSKTNSIGKWHLDKVKRGLK